MTTGSADVPKLLEQADAMRRPGTAHPEGAVPAAPDPDLVSFIRLSLDDAPAANLLQRAAAQLGPGWPATVTATTVLEEVMALTEADLGTVRLAAPGTGELRIAASAGFDQQFLDHFAVVDDDTSACGRAAAERRQTVITDVATDERFAPHRATAAASGFRAVQSTPLVDTAGNLVGIVSTYFRHPGAPSARALEVTRLYGLMAGEALARRRSGQGQTALHPDGPAGTEQSGPEPSPFLPRTEVFDLTDTIVRALLSAGLSLAGAQSLMSSSVARERVAEAIEELDQALAGIRSAVLELQR